MFASSIKGLGQAVINAVVDIGASTLFVVENMYSIVRSGVPLREFLRQLGVLGVSCLLPILLVVAPMGAVIAIEGDVIVSLFGVDRLLAPMVALAMAREIGPGLAALVFAMQAGGAIAAELASMRVHQEIDAHEAMAVDPLRHLVAPRLLAGVVVTPLLSIFSFACGFGAAYGVAVLLKGFAGAAFIENGLGQLHVADVWGGEFKAICYGFVITAVSCYHGFNARPGSVGVGEAANRAIVHSIVALPIANYVINSALYAGVSL